MRKISNKILNKAYLIQFEEKDAIDGFQVLLHNDQVAAYADNTYVVGEKHLKLLKKAGIPYKILRK